MTPLLPDSSPENLATASILVVDDDQVVLDALCAQLACDGWAVTACACPSDALAALRMRPYAAIVSDQNMPEMKGLEFLMRAREIQPAASRLLITGALSTGTLIQAINHGEIYRFLTKPWTRAELLASVRNAVQQHEMALANDRLRSEVERLRSALTAAHRELEVTRLELEAVLPTPPSRIVSSGAGLLKQTAIAFPGPTPVAAEVPHVKLVGYC